MRRTFRRVFLWLGLAAAVFLISGVAVFVVLTRKSTPPPPPNPNGYDDLLKASEFLPARRGVVAVADLDPDELRALVVTNAAALVLLRSALTRPCAVPTEAAIASAGNFYHDLVALKSLATALAAEGRLAEMEDRTPDAIRSCLDSIRLGTSTVRGGFMLHDLVGLACQSMGRTPLVKLLPKLTCEQMRPLIAELEQVDANTVSWPEVWKNEKRFFYAQLRTYRNPIRLLRDMWQGLADSKAPQEKHHRASAHLRLLTLELALRCYRCDHGTAPGSLDRLVPQYLHQIAPDPFSSHSPIYRPNGTSWVLYSLGPDKLDDGGKPVDQTTSVNFVGQFGAGTLGQDKPKGDLLYDSKW